MMKKTILIILILITSALTARPASAESPYTTWAMGPGGQLFMTQDAYQPIAEIDLPINAAEDMVITPEGYFYIADTGNGQIVKLKNFEVIETFGNEVLQGPTGLFVDEDGRMYIADAKSNTVVILDQDGNLINQFGRPPEPLFGKNNQFLPRKIAVDARKNLYIISESSVNGIVQLNTNGNFIGYFGANTATMSFKMIVQRLFLSEEQLNQFIRNVAASPTNIAIDNQSMVYTITAGTSGEKSIRKFTVAGKNIFPDSHGSSTFRDIDISDQGLVIAVDANGQLYEYDSSGTLLFVFGAQDKGNQRMGTLRNPTAISRFEDNIYILDKEKNAIVIYTTTAFAEEVHNGVDLYMEGFYQDAKPYFDDVLDYNGSFIMAYQAIADAHYKERNFDQALQAYKYAEDRSGYSQAFWELRNTVLQEQLSKVILWGIGLWVASAVVTHYERKHKWFDPIRNWFTGLQKYKLVDDLVFMFRFIKKPADSFYYIKKDLRGSLLFAVILYIWVIVMRVLSLYLTGFIFNPYTDPADIPVANEIIYTLVLFILWNASNYLISTISDGEGRVKDVVIGSAYSLFPYALFALPIALLSRVLTFNEIFIYSMMTNLMWAWVGIMLFVMVMEIHNYRFKETVKIVLLTLFTMALFVLVGYILYVLFGQLFDFISAILQEVRLRG